MAELIQENAQVTRLQGGDDRAEVDIEGLLPNSPPRVHKHPRMDSGPLSYNEKKKAIPKPKIKKGKTKKKHQGGKSHLTLVIAKL